ncbi:unnamed protein product [Larinioides sclopetarius]|uniref:Uncharacterized protein n=1 Tax=Larinioides sclopetarius TaxID=280406 RepID=A0AAV2BNN3_9ARAC
MFEAGMEYVERKKILDDFKERNNELMGVFNEMHSTRKRIVINFIDVVLENSSMTFPAHIDPSEFRDNLNQMKRPIEMYWRKFEEFLNRLLQNCKELDDTILQFDRGSKMDRSRKISECRLCYSKLEEFRRDFFCAVKPVEEIALSWLFDRCSLLLK